MKMTKMRKTERTPKAAKKRTSSIAAGSSRSKKSAAPCASAGRKASVDVGKNFKAVFDRVSEGVFVVDIQTKHFVYANPAVCRMLGYTARELTGLSLTDVHPKHEWPFLSSGFDAMARGEITFAAEIPCLSKDGRILHADVNSTRLELADRSYLIALFTDIEKIKGVRHVLSNSEKHLKLILDQSFDGINICEYDMQTDNRRLVMCNDRFTQMAGRTREELADADNINDFVVFHGVKSGHKNCHEFIKSQKAFRGQASWIRPDGKENYFDWVAAPTKIGERYYLVGIDRDITEQKKAEQESRHAEVKYRTLVEQIPAITYTAALDETSTTLYVSPQVRDILGLTQEQYKQDPDLWVRQLHPEDRQRVLEVLKESHSSGGPFRCEYRMLSSKGEVVWVRDDASIIKDEQGRGLFLQGVMFDVTEQKRAEQVLRQTEESLRAAKDELEDRVKQRTSDLERVNKQLRSEIATRKQAETKLLQYQDQLRSLASELSLAEERTRRQIAVDVHDHIGQNLAMVRIKLQSLAEAVRDIEQAHIADEIANIIAEVIESTRTLTFEISPPVLYELGFEAAVEWLLRKARSQQGLTTTFLNDGRKKPLDENVRVFLFQAVRELVTNVQKHAKAKTLTVSISRLNNHIQVGVTDDGVGFDREKVGSVYPNPRGFGLFSIKERLSCIGGRLNIESAPGKGTDITITAPLAPKERDKGGKANGHKNNTGR